MAYAEKPADTIIDLANLTWFIQSYMDCQQQVSHAFRDLENWLKMSIFNTARSGYFSSDRAIREYARDIWHVQPVRITLDAAGQNTDSKVKVPTAS